MALKRISKTLCSLQTQEGPVPYLLTRSSRRRTLAIAIDEQAQVSVFAPFFITGKEVQAFITEKAQWISQKVQEAKKVKDILDTKKFDHGAEFLFLGRKVKLNIREANLQRCRLQYDGIQWTMCVPQDLTNEQRQSQIKAKLIQWYRTQANEILGGRIFHYSRLMRVEPKKIAVRSQKRLWGSCDYSTQTIHLNWQIILSPPLVIDYVVVHELCHLMIPNHSKRFWKKVEKVMPDFKKQKKWLRANHLDMMLP